MMNSDENYIQFFGEFFLFFGTLSKKVLFDEKTLLHGDRGVFSCFEANRRPRRRSRAAPARARARRRSLEREP